MDGTRIDHIELDTDENGVVDRWEYYDADKHLVKVGISRQNDGIIDAFEFYGRGNGNDDVITRIEVSTRRDNRFNRVEFYADGILARVEEDADGDAASTSGSCIARSLTGGLATRHPASCRLPLTRPIVEPRHDAGWRV